nr:hypothetical protein 14 [Balneolaceae bacterium]
MEQCPKCKNKGWKPTDDFKYPLKNYGKVKHRTFSLRYIMCLNCGHRFKTIEQYFDDVKDQINDLLNEEDEYSNNLFSEEVSDAVDS